jgi:hypothetical protein
VRARRADGRVDHILGVLMAVPSALVGGGILQFRTADQQRRSLCVGEAKQLDIATQWETVILDQRAVHPPSTTRE